MVTQKVKTWDVLQEHPITKTLDSDTKLALLCEYVDLYDELQGMPLGEFIVAFLADSGEADAGDQVDAEDEVEAAPKPSSNGNVAAPADGTKPASMVGMRVVYRFPGRNVLSDTAGVTRDVNGAVSFTDVEGEPWSNVDRNRVDPIKPDEKYHREVHISRREAKDISGWLAGTPSTEHADGSLLRTIFVEFPKQPEITERIVFAVMNGKRPYVDRFVQLPNNGFEDDQKPTTRLFGEHCFRVRDEDYVVNVVSP